MSLQSENQWDENDSDLFLKYGAAFVPCRAEQFRIVCPLIAAASPRRIVDLCCGEGHLSRALLEALPTAHVEGLDASERMLQSARAGLQVYGHRFRATPFDVHDRAWRHPSTPVDAFVSSLALHHLTREEKGPFYRDLFDALAPGGVFVNADLVLPATPAGLAVAADAWDRAVCSSGERAGDPDAYAAFESLRWNLFRYPEDNDTDYPLPIATELTLLTAAGFADVDVHWMYAGHAIWGGRKA